ncbi:MAG TPA: ribosome biogenesis GTP-binding protein YihA/YsxC [Bryobacteraceae bacterium]|nr:ribosome biogenesis GTP-binding protein YihA/YsxC [Bryobacteraceae bacterium]
MQAQLLVSATAPDRFPPESLPEFAFLGRSNVGKSSLLNTLAGKPGLAHTSSTPGRTQAINFFRVDGPGGQLVHLVDLPGYGFARVPLPVKEQWQRLIESYLTRRSTLELCFLLLDARRGWMDMDLELKAWLEAHDRNYVVIATKVDKLNQKEQHHNLSAIREQLGDRELFPFSAANGRGAREIWQAISKIKNSR